MKVQNQMMDTLLVHTLSRSAEASQYSCHQPGAFSFIQRTPEVARAATYYLFLRRERESSLHRQKAPDIARPS